MYFATKLQRLARTFALKSNSKAMRIGIIDRVIFSVLTSTCVRELQEEHPEWKEKSIRKTARRRFVKMMKDTPDIGSYSQNHLKICLVGCAVWFSIYEAVEELYGKMPTELYGRMCNAAMSMPLMKRKYARTPFFTAKYQDSYIKKAEKSGRIKSEYNWDMVVEKCETPDALKVRFTQCGLCALAKRTGHKDILPAMCLTDYTVADQMGAVLHRNKTLASGDPVCEYLYTRPGSDPEKRWQQEHRDGRFLKK